MTRVPAYLMILALIAAVVALAQLRETAIDVSEPVTTRSSRPLSAADDTGSTWYCAAGFTTPDGSNDHQVIITNTDDVPVSGTLTLFPSRNDVLGNPVPFDRAVQAVSVGPGQSESISLAPVVATLDPLLDTNTGSFVGALVEFPLGDVRVEHAVISTIGRGQSNCATDAGSTWWFPSGTTTTDVTTQLYLLNPFADEAVVDITFVTDEGLRAPTTLDGRLVPAQSLSVIDITPIVPVWSQVSAEVTTRTGQVIVERIELFGAEAGPNGLSLALGTNQLSDQWFFPAGGAVTAAGESYVIFNPSSEPAEVEFELKPDSADRVGDIAPLSVPLGPNERWVVTVAGHATHPADTLAAIDATSLVVAGEQYFVTIRSFNGVPIVAERVITRPLEAGRGISQSLGATVAASVGAVAVPDGLFADSEATERGDLGQLAVMNPAGDTIARIEVWVGGDGGEPLLRRQAELAPRRRAAFDLATLLDPDDRWVQVRASNPVIGELVAVGERAVSASPVVPDAAAIEVPELFAFE